MKQGRTITAIIEKPNKGIEVHHRGPRDRKGTPSNVKELIEAEPDPSFRKAMKVLAGALAETTSAAHYKHAMQELGFEMEAEDHKKLFNRIVKSIAITQVKLNWENDEVFSVILRGKFTNRVGEEREVTSPAIQLGLEQYGWESNLRKSLNVVIEAAKEYLAGKYTQIEQEAPEEAKEEAEEPEEVEAEASTGKGRQRTLRLPQATEQRAVA